MCASKITIFGSSQEYSSNHLVSELCQIDNVELLIYDVNRKSELGMYGSKLAIQASAMNPSMKIKHSDDLEECLDTNVLIVWGVYFNGSRSYNAVYKDLFSGKFKEAFAKLLGKNEKYKLDVLFLKSHSSGLQMATILGQEIPKLKPNIFVLDAVSDGRELNVYPKVDGTFKEIGFLQPEMKLQIESLQTVIGGMMDVDVLVRSVKGILFDDKYPREIFDYVGVFPTRADIEKFKLRGNVVSFLPNDDEDKKTEDLKVVIREEESALIATVK